MELAAEPVRGADLGDRDGGRIGRDTHEPCNGRHVSALR